MSKKVPVRLLDDGAAEQSEDPANVKSFNNERYLNALREQMLKFAKLQLKDDAQAEDAVQEALLGAMKNAGSFAGRAALKTWVFAILRNKIADSLRGKIRSREITNVMGDEEDENALDLFNNTGQWKTGEAPISWGDPEASFQQDEFWQVFEACLQGLPEAQARVFMMREFIGLESGEICAQLALSTSNLHVMLHRARLRLRECLENRWFTGG